MSRPRSSREREERLATLWMAFINDSGFACNSTWVPSMSIADIKCSLPTTAHEWSKVSISRSAQWLFNAEHKIQLDDMLDNPQNPESEDFFTS